jgi:hypothetical protein
MRNLRLLGLVLLFVIGEGAQAQTKRSDDFHARYGLKEVVVMSRPWWCPSPSRD